MNVPTWLEQYQRVRRWRDRLSEQRRPGDESVNNPTLFAAVIDLLERGHLSGASPLWNKKRIRGDGSIVYVLGGVT